jgi:hypothetical protein
MEQGDDYHGSRPVCAFTDKDEAKSYGEKCYANQVRGCGSETCNHKYFYSVVDVSLISGFKWFWRFLLH